MKRSAAGTPSSWWPAVRALLAAVAVAHAGATAAQATCQGGGTAQSVTSAQNLNQIIESSTSAGGGCTITAAAGTYTAQGTVLRPTDTVFRILQGITVQAAVPGTAILSVSNQGFGVIIQSFSAGIAPTTRIPNGAILDGFVINGGRTGVLVQDLANLNGGTLNNITLRNLTINGNTNGAGNGITLSSVTDSVIDSVTVVNAFSNGIFLAGGARNILMNNTIQQTVTQHGIALQGSDANSIVGNTLGVGTTGPAFSGIVLNRSGGVNAATPGDSFNRIERNTLRNHATDGITVTDGSLANYVGHNVIRSNSYDPVSRPAPNPTTGVGIWINNGSNGSYVYGNDAAGSPETGIDVFMSSNNYIQANVVHADFAAGILVTDDRNFSDAGAVNPANTVIHSNFGYFNTFNAQIVIRGSSADDIAFNFLSGQEYFGINGGALAGTGTGGTSIFNSAVNRVYENTITDVDTRQFVNSDVASTQLFRNRHLNGSNNPSAPAGRRGLTYSLAPAGATWDASVFLGGNHWSEFAVGNPSATTPYKNFVHDNTSGIDGRGPYADKFPFAGQDLGRGFGVTSVLEPFAGQVIGAGTRKTIAWRSSGCVFVDLVLQGPTNQTIATNWADYGYYNWDVPAAGLVPGNTYTVRVDCKSSSLVVTGLSGTSSAFTIGNANVTLMVPGRNARVVNLSVLRVAWKKAASVATVNVFVRNGIGGETPVCTNVAGTFCDATLPSGMNNSNQVRVRVVSSSDANAQDAIDGIVMVRGPAVFGFTTALGGTNLRIGSILPIRWVGPNGSFLVDLDLMEGGTAVQRLATNLPDFGNFLWLVPEYWSTASTLRATFKDENGTPIGGGAVSSGVFRILYTTTPGVLADRYRLNSPVTLEHMFTTDQNEYNVLSTLTNIWQAEGARMRVYDGPNNTGGVEAIPYYRLYDHNNRWHLWTTDRNEYFTLRQFPAIYDAEGVDGYIFPTQVAGTIRLDRLLFAPINGLHHWTTDQFERTSLKNGGAWIDDHLDGFVFPFP